MFFLRLRNFLLSSLACSLLAQDPTALDPQGIRQAISTEKDKNQPVDATPKPIETSKGKEGESATRDAILEMESQRLAREIQLLKMKEHLPRRFGADLFDFREELPPSTDGGISEDYVLGVGDQLQVMGIGSATFELPTNVNGRGDVVIPKVGSVRVAGLSLGKAKAAVQGKVNQQLAGTLVDINITKPRQVRIFILGEVYKPGSYLAPSLSSIVNVLSLAGGPTGVGTFRQIRIIRSGKVVQEIDLYPLRAEGKGNLNISLQSGDTLFVPLVVNPVMLEGSFLRVAGGSHQSNAGQEGVPNQGVFGQVHATVPVEHKAKEGTQPPVPTPASREEGTPAMQFELLPGETAKSALDFAGGLLPNAYTGALTLRRQTPEGVTSVIDLQVDKLGACELKPGDILSALPRRSRTEALVSVVGWARVPGTFARTAGLKVGDLLRNQDQVMPDTYLQRGDIVRTLDDGSTRYFSFDIAKAMTGDPQHNLPLENRDKVELYRKDRMRLPKVVTLSGPFTKAGTYPFHEGMRVSDLVFQAGIPEKKANSLVAELARARGGMPSEIIKIDLAGVTFTEAGSPSNIADPNLNPPLREDDQITIYEKPGFSIHKVVRISGQVARPGEYVLDSDHATLAGLITRAGGLTPEAMPRAGIFFRSLQAGNLDQDSASLIGSSGIDEILERLNETKMFDGKGEAKVSTPNGLPIYKFPVLHGLTSGKLNRVVVDFTGALNGNRDADLELNDHDEIIIPRKTETVLIIGETATPFAFHRVKPGMTVGDLLSLAGGTTRNADTSNIRLLKADGRIEDSWVTHKKVEPGDAVLVPQKIRRDTTWQETLGALTPLAILINAVRR